MNNNDEDLTCHAENKRKRKKISSNCDSPFNNLNSNYFISRKELLVKNISATNKSVDILHLSKDNTINLCRLVVNTIKTMIGIDNDNFDEYRNHIEKKGIDNKVVLRHLLSKETILELSEKVKDFRIDKYKLQIERCLQVIAPLFIACSNYKCLKNFLKVKTTLEDKQIRNTIKKYVSLLEKINPEFNVRKWLPRETILKYTYKITKNLVEELGLEKTDIKGILLKPDNREKFEELAKYHLNSEIPIIAKCCSCGKIWDTTPRSIKRKYWCGQCDYSNRKLNLEDLNSIAESKNLELISNYEVYENLLTILVWKCKICRISFKENTHNVKRAKCPCPTCYKPYQLIVWDKEFENTLQKNIMFIVSRLPFNKNLEDEKELIVQKSLQLWKKLIEIGLEPDYLGIDRNSISLSFSIIYFVLLSIGIEQIGNQPLSARAIFKSLGANIKDLGLINETQFHIAPGKLYNFLPDEYKKVFDEQAKFFELSYKRIKRFIEKVLEAKLITSEREFNINKEKDNTSAVYTKIEVSCIKGHIWSTTYNYLKWHGSWCPDCAQGRYERIIRWYFEKIFSLICNFNVNFPNTNLSDAIDITYKNKIIQNFISYSHFDGYTKLSKFKEINIISQKTNNNLLKTYKKNYKISVFNNEKLQNLFDQITYDYLVSDIFENNDDLIIEFPFGYITLKFLDEEVKLTKSELKSYKFNTFPNHFKLAFEYNGLQHYIYPNYYHSSFKQFLSRVVNDLLKKHISMDNNIILIEIPYSICPNMNNPKNIQNYIINEFQRKTDINLGNYNLPNFDHITQGFYSYESNNFYKDLGDY